MAGERDQVGVGYFWNTGRNNSEDGSVVEEWEVDNADRLVTRQCMFFSGAALAGPALGWTIYGLTYALSSSESAQHVTFLLACGLSLASAVSTAAILCADTCRGDSEEAVRPLFT